MRIESLHFKNITEGWELSETKFDDLNLLVGVSGAGKTQILEAIRTILRMAQGDESIFDGSWTLKIRVEGKAYIWEGKTNMGVGFWVNLDQEIEQKLFLIEYEKLTSENDVIFERKPESTIFRGNKINGLSSELSLIEHFHADDEVKSIHNGLSFLRSNLNSTGYPQVISISSDSVSSLTNQLQLDELKKSGLSITWKLFLLQEKFPELFEKLSADFFSIFKEIDRIEIWLQIVSDMRSNKSYPEIKFRIGDQFIPQVKISSGMLKTFLLLSEIEVAPDGTIFLIDEIENSLGINCLDVVTERIVQESGRLQFILTSHHPDIINHIDREHWKIVTRKGGVITTKTPAELHMPESHQEPFLQLFNLKAYREGVQAA